ncbi:endocuticle structural glycoprotein SgAbd-3 [Drosophila grimshawi]|uniref:GH20699 n=1 Tax=Drosophila grimshawi TaxID=7222 RepID=B4J717_DROGR|nr:endocuticle structural glycoprotein SgAbd-3 [Drosophila grimshawi]EDW01005.1 GH20699 [Drosophila grimshawi]
MKLILLCALFAAVSHAADNNDFIVNESNVEHNGKFFYHYLLHDGSEVAQNGNLKKIDKEKTGEAVTGSFKFIGDDGIEYSTYYVADENGYIPAGDHLPTPPPTPESVLKALAYIEKHPYMPNKKKH